MHGAFFHTWRLDGLARQRRETSSVKLVGFEAKPCRLFGRNWILARQRCQPFHSFPLIRRWHIHDTVFVALKIFEGLRVAEPRITVQPSGQNDETGARFGLPSWLIELTIATGLPKYRMLGVIVLNSNSSFALLLFMKT